MNIKEKVVIITGGGQGLGKSLALLLSQEGAIVFLVGRTESKLKAVVEEIKSRGGVANYFVVDISNPDALVFIDKILDETNKIDILINNAGWSPPLKTIESLSIEEIKETININLLANFCLLRKTVPVFKKQNSGIIINISSKAGSVGYPRLAPYSSSKFGLEGLTQSVAKELEATNVKCISVAPGPLNTPMREKLFGDAKQKEDPSLTALGIINLIKNN